MGILLSFLVGFVGVWLFFRLSVIPPSQCNNKESIIDVANVYGSNKKICKELKRYALHQINKGNYEYAEVIDIIKKRQFDDKIRT